ncbi:MAG: hypothetical protein R3A13_00395 [Bdellovibrionota bacterium]
MDESQSVNDPMKVLFIDRDLERVSSMKELFLPEFPFSNLEITNRPRKAIQLLREEDYDAIYVHDEFERPD